MVPAFNSAEMRMTATARLLTSFCREGGAAMHCPLQP